MKRKPATPLRWKMETLRGMPAYRAGNFFIERRFRWSYLGGGRQASVQVFWLHDGSTRHGPFNRVMDAKKFASNAAMFRELGEL